MMTGAILGGSSVEQAARLQMVIMFMISSCTALSSIVTTILALGVVVGIAGHLAGSRRTVVAGLAVLFLATVLLLAGGYAAYRDDPAADPRPCTTPESC